MTRLARPPRLAALALFGIVLLTIFLPASALAGKRSSGPTKGSTSHFVKVATHPQAAAQPTEVGKTIVTLKAWNGKLYSGYGDYGANTGPIAITPFDGATFASAPELAAADTEAIYSYRSINGKLYAPSIDPRASSDFAVATGGSDRPSWLNPSPIRTTHAFDMVTLTGQDLWLVGSSGNDAVVWRSLDDGATWSEMLRVPPLDPVAGDFARFYGAAVHGGKLYVQALDYYGYIHPGSKVFDGSSWSDGPSFNVVFNHAETFAGKLLYHGTGHSGAYSGPLLTFDGLATATAYSSIYDYTIDGNTLYALTTDRKVVATQDLRTWTQVASAPSVARSIGVLNGAIYVGGTDSAIYRR